LLGFENEVAALVKIDAAVTDPVAAFLEGNGPLENIIIMLMFGRGRLGRLDLKHGT